MPKDKKKKLFTATYTFEGKRYYVRSSVSQREADKKAAKALQEREDGANIIQPNMLVGKYALQWAATYKSTTASKPVYDSYVARINNHIMPVIGAMRICDVRLSNLQDLMNRQLGRSKSHCDKLIVTLRGIFHQAFRDGLARIDLSEGIQSPQAKDGTHRSITPEERAAALKTAAFHRFGLAVKLILYCGLRPQEVAALKWSDIDQINGRIVVRRALKKSGVISETKTDAGKRDIPIPSALWECLQIPDNIDSYVVTNTHGEHHSHTSMRKAWCSFKRSMDIALGAETEKNEDGSIKTRYNVPVIIKSAIAPDLDMYCFRHTYCTDLQQAGIPINIAKYLMGHSSIAITAQIYTHMREDTLSDVAVKLNALGATVGATQEGIKPGKQSKNDSHTEPEIAAK